MYTVAIEEMVVASVQLPLFPQLLQMAPQLAINMISTIPENKIQIYIPFFGNVFRRCNGITTEL